ncbi:MAG: hypothetical protein JXR76_08665 [Deltaproteobacteria bacterium]|nr:hypothetical protein [Deltaproteobacteria bacterium]
MKRIFVLKISNGSATDFLWLLIAVFCFSCQVTVSDGQVECGEHNECPGAFPHCYAKTSGALRCWKNPNQNEFNSDTDTGDEKRADSLWLSTDWNDSDSPMDTATQSEVLPETDSETAEVVTQPSDSDADTLNDLVVVDTGSALDSAAVDTAKIEDTADTEPDSDCCTDSGTTPTDSDTSPLTEVDSGSDSFTDTESDTEIDTETDTDWGDTVTDTQTESDSTTAVVPKDTSGDPPDVALARVMMDMTPLHSEGVTVFSTTPRLGFEGLVYIGTVAGNVYRIDDIRERPFRVVRRDVSEVTVDMNGELVQMAMPNIPVSSIAIDPSDVRKVYVSFAGNGDSLPILVWRSVDGGDTFKPLLNSPREWPSVLSVSPFSGLIYLTQMDHVKTSEDNGLTWQDRPSLDELFYHLSQKDGDIEDDDQISVVTLCRDLFDTASEVPVSGYAGTLQGKILNFFNTDTDTDTDTDVDLYVTLIPPQEPSGGAAQIPFGMFPRALAYLYEKFGDLYISYSMDSSNPSFPHIWSKTYNEETKANEWDAFGSVDGYGATGAISYNTFFNTIAVYFYSLTSECAYRADRRFNIIEEYCRSSY